MNFIKIMEEYDNAIVKENQKLGRILESLLEQSEEDQVPSDGQKPIIDEV